MTARLFSKTGETRGVEAAIDGEATIGRDRESTLVIDRPLMSSRHARIYFDADEERYVLEDLGSLNGTALDGDPVTGPERLGHLHVVTFAGTYDFFFFDPERARRRHPHPPAEPARRLEAPAATAAARDDSKEVTAVESEPLALPGFLARRADAMGEPAEREVDPEVTSIEREPVALPDFLARRADAMGDEPVVDPEVTSIEREPIVLPGALARRADRARAKKEPDETGDAPPAAGGPAAGAPAAAAQQHETVDLSEIEELIAAEAGHEPRRRADRRRAVEYQLVITEAGGRVRRFTLDEGANRIGRGRDAAVTLDYPDLSRRHAMLTLDGHEIRLRDLGSRNGTFLDDQPVAAEVEVRPGARLRFGSVEARLVQVGDGADGSPPAGDEGDDS